MFNTVKLLTDKTEYVCNTQDVKITVSNLSSLGVKNLFLTSNGLDRYPIKSINGNVVTIDSSIIPNNTSKYFMLYGEKELPKLEFSNLKTEYIKAKDYTLDIIRGSWADSIPSSVAGVYLEIVFGEDETLVHKFSTNLKGKMSSSIIQTTINMFNVRIPSGYNKYKFKLFSEDSSSNRTYYAESDFYNIEMIPNSANAERILVFLHANELVFEANQKYKLLVSSTVDFKHLYPNLLVESLSPTIVQQIVKCTIVDDCYLEFTMPNLSSKLSDGSIFTLYANFFETQNEADNEIYAEEMYSTGYKCTYLNNINNKHSLV